MNTRPLGKTGFSIAPLVFGGNVFGWTCDEKTSFAILDAFVDHGLTPLIPLMSTPAGRMATRVASRKP